LRGPRKRNKNGINSRQQDNSHLHNPSLELKQAA
jgi:hypothetical protein